MWAHNIITYPNSMAYVAYSNTPTGPFTVATSTLNPDGMGLNDMNLFTDTDGTGYVIYSNGTNTHFVISRLSSDYLSTSGSYIMPANFVNHEAPAMVKRGNIYYLWCYGLGSESELLCNIYESSRNMVCFGKSIPAKWYSRPNHQL